MSDVTVGLPQHAVAGTRAVGVVESAEGVWVYKIAEAWKTSADLRRELSVFELLPTAGFHQIPKLLPTRDGQLFGEVEGRHVYLLEHVEGSHPDPAPETYRRLGALTAALHSVVGPLPETDFRPASIIETDLPQIARTLPFGNDYLSLCRSLPDFGRLPRAVIHTDVSPGNVIRRLDGSLILIDLDDLGVGTRVLDTAFPLIQQFVSEQCEVQEENARAFYGAYSERVRLTAE